MKRLVKSTKSGVFCVKCDGLIPVGTSRFIDGGMHYHFNCTTKADVKREVETESFITWLLNKIK